MWQHREYRVRAGTGGSGVFITVVAGCFGKIVEVGEAIWLRIRRQAGVLEGLDPAWQLEAYFSANQVEERITTRVARQIFDCLPRSGRAVSVTDAAAKLDLLSKASHVAGAHAFAVVSRVRVCVEYLEHIGRGLPLDQPPLWDLFLDQ